MILYGRKVWLRRDWIVRMKFRVRREAKTETYSRQLVMLVVERVVKWMLCAGDVGEWSTRGFDGLHALL